MQDRRRLPQTAWYAEGFLQGKNSSCQLHIHQHFALYKERCEKGNIPIDHWAIPWSIWQKMEEKKRCQKASYEEAGAASTQL
jgi:hypothetical protein